MASEKIKKTPQYQVYLEALETLKRESYEISQKNDYQSIVKRGKENYGIVWVVNIPSGFIYEDDSSCFIKEDVSFGGFVKDSGKEGAGCLFELLPGSEIIKSLITYSRRHSDYKIVQPFVNSSCSSNDLSKKYRSKSYWPENCLVGGYTRNHKDIYFRVSNPTYNEEWLNILASVISKYEPIPKFDETSDTDSSTIVNIVDKIVDSPLSDLLDLV